MAGSGAALAVLVLYQTWFPGEGWPLSLKLAAAALSLALGALIGWGLMLPESRLLTQLRQALEVIASDQPGREPLPKGATREVDELRRAVLDLGRSWQQHEEAERTRRARLEEISQTKTNILSMVSHDLRTPLTSIQLYSQMMQDDLAALTADDQKNFLTIITEESQRLSRLVDDLLETQKIDEGRCELKLSPHDITDTILTCSRIFAPTAQRHGIEFTMHCPDQLPEILCVPDKITQVVNNLLSNALKYGSSGGRIELRVSARSEELAISVRDYGPGIPAENTERIFNRFIQLDQGKEREFAGCGLGLFIVKEIVEQHHGRVWVESERGRGAEFIVALPTCNIEPQQPPVRVADAHEPLAVICEADSGLASVISQSLRKRGFNVTVTNTGTQLFEKLDAVTPDFVLTDAIFNDMTSHDFFRSLERFRPLPFQLVLHTYDGDFADLRLMGVDIMLHRPASREDLDCCIAVARHRATSSGRLIGLLTNSHVDSELLTLYLQNAGHLVLVARSHDAAKRLANSYPIDEFILHADSLGPGWTELRALKSALIEGARLTVLTESIGQQEHRWSEATGARIERFVQGQEAATAKSLGGDAPRSISGATV